MGRELKAATQDHVAEPLVGRELKAATQTMLRSPLWGRAAAQRETKRSGLAQ